MHKKVKESIVQKKITSATWKTILRNSPKIRKKRKNKIKS